MTNKTGSFGKVDFKSTAFGVGIANPDQAEDYCLKSSSEVLMVK